jgi:hypothetical protein
VYKILQARFGDATAILNADELTPDQYGPFCEMVAATYQETLKLPQTQAVPLLRYLFEAARNGAG